MQRFGEDDARFAEKLFETVRGLSADNRGVSRQGYSAQESQVLEVLKDIGTELKLEIETDPAGNVWMTRPGVDRSLPALVSGSHVDSVPQGGNYDGLAGVAAALMVARRLRLDRDALKRDFRVLAMRCEESSFFGKPYIGSLGMMGKLTEADLALKHRTLPMTLGEAIRSQGIDTAPLTSGHPLVDLSKIEAFVELHIEQGPRLDSSEAARVGVVTGIRGNVRHKEVRCVGKTAHSGAVDKEFRHDAVMATAELISTMERHWQEWLDKGEDLVFTVGVLKTAPSAAISVIPGETSFTVDIRSLSSGTALRFHELLDSEAKRIAGERGVRFEFDKMMRTAPASVNAKLCDRLAAEADKAGIGCQKLASGAGHDTAVLGNAGVPVGMIFVANQNGSHNPDETMKIEDFMQGAELLRLFALGYDRM